MRSYVSFLLYPVAEKLAKRAIRAKLDEARKLYAMPFAQRKRYNLHSLHALLRHAALHVPYYRRLFAENRFDPDFVLDSPSALEMLPFLTKKIIQEQGAELFDERHPPRIKRITGASTGPATSLFFDQNALDWSAANNLLALEWVGKPLGRREAHLSTHFAHTQRLDTFKEALKCFVLNRRNVYTRQWDEASLERLCRDLQSAKAFLVQGHPSTMYALAEYVKCSGTSVRWPLFSLFESTGEKLEAHQRKSIEETLGCAVFDRYGGAEFGVVAHETASQRGNGCLKVMDHHVWVEDHPVGGGLNEFVFTGLTNYAMPLIRYKVGDLGRVLREEEGPVLSGLEGRVHDIVLLRGKQYPTHYFHDILTRVGNVKDFQVIVDEAGCFLELLLVLENRSLDELVARNISTELGFQVPIKFCGLKDFSLAGWRNKFRYVIQRPKKDAVSRGISNAGEDAISRGISNAGESAIAVVCHSLVLDGANNHLRELFKHFQGTCHFEVFSVSDGMMRGVFEQLGVPVHLLDPEHVDKQLFRRFKLALGNTLLSSPILLKISECGLPLIMTIHESWRPDRLQQHINAYEVESSLTEKTVREALQACSAVIFPAAFQYDLYKPILSELTGQKYIPCVVDGDSIKEYVARTCRRSLREQFGFSETDTVFLQVGTITRRKNQKGTVKAFAELLKAYPSADYHLVLLGARNRWPVEAAYLDSVRQEIKRRGLGGRVHIHDTTPDPFPFFHVADVLVHPSYNEVLPLSLLEAAMFGIPVIASNKDGIPEIIDHEKTGLLVVPNDVHGIAEAMQNLARSPELRRYYGNACRERVLERHKPELFIQEYENAFGVHADETRPRVPTIIRR